MASSWVISRLASPFNLFQFNENVVQATGLTPLQGHRISHVVTLDIEKPPLPSTITHLFISITDEESSNLLEELPKLVAFVQNCLDKGGTALIHCRHGVSRSASAVVGVLISLGMNRERALSLVVEKRHCAAPNQGFLNQLLLWDKMRGRVDLEDANYILFLLQTGNVKYQAALTQDEYTKVKRYKCKRCRRLLASSTSVLPHTLGTFPCWYSVPPMSNLCTSGIFVTPQVRFSFRKRVPA